MGGELLVCFLPPLLCSEENTDERTKTRGVLNVTRAFASLLVQERGVIINVGSGAGVINMPWNGMALLYWN